jgi:valyl-tRNA synthetase
MTETAESNLPKTFDPAAIEAKWAQHWEANGLFRPERPDATPYTIVNPPPNVTGALHIGHALDNTLQDVLIRYERLRGKDALWVVGTDHAGIATQMVVERQLEERQDKRTNYSRDAFVEKVWEWKAESGGQITQQLRRLGCSMDWANERFTMDEGFTKAVTKVFVDLYNQGLIYRDKRLVNWDPKLKTAISDLEVETRETKGHFWSFRYPLADGVTLDDGRDHIVVSTTRPETMLADMAVAVNPEDDRYKSVIGKYVTLPLTGRRIPIVADEHADPELGTGAVKITPGHDFNDFEVGKRAGIKTADMLNMLDQDANLIQTSDGLIPAEFVGMERFEARKAVVAALKEAGLLVLHVTTDKNGETQEHDAEPRTIQTPYGDRGGVVIEPWLTDQWYVDAETLAKPAIDAVRSGKVEIVPKTWEKTYFNWMENIQPWAISRQLWWGHQIPAWFGDDGEIYVAESEEDAQAQAGSSVTLTRESDVLDTWFSSALWPFATLGWPENTTALQRHYPNDVLISGFDILFFWDARMLMQGIHFMKDIPWKTLYLHGLVRAADGQKMSKSKGNVVNPLGLIDKYGADALRFFMSAMESQGRDIKMDDSRLEGYRNFATKLWNATRFCQTNGISASTTLAAPAATTTVNRWIIGEVTKTVAKMEEALAALRFDDAANAIYQFAWATFCDWYLELIKGQIDDETRAVAGWVLDQIFVMLHPFMPFITEELWNAQGSRPYELIVAKWPAPRAEVDAGAVADINWLITLVQSLRGAKAELGLTPGARLPLYAEDADAATKARIERLSASIDRVGRVEAIHFAPAPAGASMQLVVEGATYAVPLEGLIDVGAEKARLEKALAAAQKEAASLAGRLNNPSFVEKAKPEAVEKARADHAEKSAEAERLTAALARLG